MEQSLVSHLYSYALATGMETRYLSDRGGYHSSRQMGQRVYDTLCAHLDKEGEALLDKYLDEALIWEGMERESLFTAGLSMGLALSRLG